MRGRRRWAALVAFACVGALVLAFSPGSVASSASTAPAGGSAEAEARRAVALSQAAIGTTPANTRFIDSFGKPVSLEDLRGKPAVVSFVYTGCFQVCPVTTQFLAKAVDSARKALGHDKFTVVSIGVNQPFDTPQAMASFARQNGIRDPLWLFLSPQGEAVPALAEAFGFSYRATPKGFDHLTQLTVLDARGKIYRQVYGESFDLPMLVAPLKELLSGQAAESFTVENVWEKVKLYCTVYDPASGRYMFDYSLFVELFAGVTTLGAIGWLMIRELRRRRPG